MEPGTPPKNPQTISNEASSKMTAAQPTLRIAGVAAFLPPAPSKHTMCDAPAQADLQSGLPTNKIGSSSAGAGTRQSCSCERMPRNHSPGFSALPCSALCLKQFVSAMEGSSRPSKTGHCHARCNSVAACAPQAGHAAAVWKQSPLRWGVHHPPAWMRNCVFASLGTFANLR